MKYGTKMTRWRADNSGVEVTTPSGIFYAKHLVLAIGGWLDKNVTGLNIKVQPVAVQVYFWDINPNENGHYEIDKRSPNLIISDVWKDEELFMIPSVDYAGKVKAFFKI
jgi:glycine/D-amino acid oxidase-like deaminating enzyme